MSAGCKNAIIYWSLRISQNILLHFTGHLVRKEIHYKMYYLKLLFWRILNRPDLDTSKNTGYDFMGGVADDEVLVTTSNIYIFFKLMEPVVNFSSKSIFIPVPKTFLSTNSQFALFVTNDNRESYGKKTITVRCML